MAISFNDWLADRQRLYSVVQNVFKLKKLTFQADEKQANFRFDTRDMKGVEAFVNAKQTLETMGFKDRHGTAITSTNDLSLVKSGKGLIEAFTKTPSEIDVCLGTAFEVGSFDAVHRFNDEHPEFMRKYDDSANLIEVLGHNNSNPQMFRRENSRKIILDLMKIGFKKIPNEYKKNEAETVLFYDGLFMFCYTDYKITWQDYL